MKRKQKLFYSKQMLWIKIKMYLCFNGQGKAECGILSREYQELVLITDSGRVAVISDYLCGGKEEGGSEDR